MSLSYHQVRRREKNFYRLNFLRKNNLFRRSFFSFVLTIGSAHRSSAFKFRKTIKHTKELNIFFFNYFEIRFFMTTKNISAWISFNKMWHKNFPCLASALIILINSYVETRKNPKKSSLSFSSFFDRKK